MGANKKSNFQKCGNILIDINTLKSQIKTCVITCGFCDAEYDQMEIFSQHLEEKHSHHFDTVGLDPVTEPENNSSLTIEQEASKIDDQPVVNVAEIEKMRSSFNPNEGYEHPLGSGPSHETRNAEEIIVTPLKREYDDSYDDDDEYWDPQRNKRFNNTSRGYSEDEMDAIQKTNYYANVKEYPSKESISGNSKNDNGEFNIVDPLASKVNQIHELLLQGKSCREISILLNISKTSVGRLRKALPNLPLPSRGGRKKLLSETIEQHILRDIRQQKFENAVQIQKQLAENENIHVSVETVRKILRSVGFRGRAKVKKPLLTKNHRKFRFDFARKYISWKTEDWAKVIWSGETKINRSGTNESVIVWGCMMAKGVGTVHRVVDTQSFIDILSAYLPATAEMLSLQMADIFFQYDVDDKHTAKLTHKWLIDNKYNVLYWPSQSPDLNPIENLWEVLKRDAGTPENLNELWTNMQTAWNSIEPNYCKFIVDSMPRRMEAVIAAKGGYINF